jgi:hypothetical protein
MFDFKVKDNAMSVQRVPGLRIEFARDGKSLVLTDKNDREEKIPCRLSDRDAGEYRKALKRGLDQMKACVRDPKPSIKDAAKALGELNHRGLSLVWQIFGEHRERLVRVFQESFLGWRTETEPIVITVAAELSRFVPIEFLPLFELSEWPKPDDLPTLEEAARRFPGFSAILQREFPNISVSQDLLLDNDPKLPLKCFYNSSLRGADQEIQFFQNNKNCIDIDGPWPERQLSGNDFPRSLALHLRYADRRFNGQYRTPVDQIQHFVCHCEVDDEVSSDSCLRLTFGNEATIADLQSFFAVFEERSRSREGPLIFLNACESSRIDPMGVTSFPRFFLEENRNRGFIGTETNIPDGFASDFSQYFYRSLLKGINLGKAIFQAKWTMLRERNNPLGILYVVYADPDLHVSKPVEFVS